jgi:hypothetical protein
MENFEKKMAALKMAHVHQIEMLKSGIHSNIEYITYRSSFGDKSEYWEYYVAYIDDTGTGDTGCTFDEGSL